MPKRVAIVSPTQNERDRAFLTGLGRFASASNWDTFVDISCIAARDPEWLVAANWDGIIYNHPKRGLPIVCRQRSIPCIDLCDDAPSIEQIPKLRPNNQEVGRLAAIHFLELGFRSFAFSGVADSPSSLQRLAGYKAELTSRNFRCSTFETINESETPESIEISHTEKTDKSSLQLREWLSSLKHPIALFACNDAHAATIAQACASLQLQCPNDIAILGVNNESFVCELSKPPLSSIALNDERRGHIAGRLLQDLMTGASVGNLHLVPPSGIVTRVSTDAKTLQDKIVAKALSIISEQACNGLRVEELAKSVHASRRMLERKFQQHLGTSPNQAIRNAQVSKIKGLLNQTDMSHSEIAYATGFEHPEYMNVVFKRITGMTPGSYRNKTHTSSPSERFA